MRRAVRIPGLSRDYGAHEFVGMQAALHQSFDLAGRDKSNRLDGQVFTMLGIHNLDCTEVDA